MFKKLYPPREITTPTAWKQFSLRLNYLAHVAAPPSIHSTFWKTRKTIQTMPALLMSTLFVPA